MKNATDELLLVVVDNRIPKEPIDNYRKHLGLSKPLTIATVSLDALHDQAFKLNDHAIANIFLADDERNRFNVFRYLKRKREWLGGRIAAKLAVAEYLLGELAPDETNWSEWQIIPDTNGKPHVESTTKRENNPPHISISHSGGLAIALASPLPCGIDIQKKTATVTKVRDRFSEPQEVSIMNSNQNFAGMDEATKLTMLWAAKEAVRKTVDVSPLLGFKEMNLVKVFDQHHDFRLLELACQPGNSRMAKKNNSGSADNNFGTFPDKIAVTVLSFTDYAVAFATLPTKAN